MKFTQVSQFVGKTVTGNKGNNVHPIYYMQINKKMILQCENGGCPMSWNSPVIDIGAKSVERLCKGVRVDDWSTMKYFKLGGKVMNKEQLVEQTKTQFYSETLSRKMLKFV